MNKCINLVQLLELGMKRISLGLLINGHTADSTVQRAVSCGTQMLSEGLKCSPCGHCCSVWSPNMHWTYLEQEYGYEKFETAIFGGQITITGSRLIQLTFA